ncbi:DUF6891 domain-containing protein [Nocardioides sp. CPCC 205120]|uniref:DUF6891 domain-containing protein n=1 Tax=Nocardioides sp. CPCC 205120 TaxID=3406462 RepID=UPI003B501B18
MTPRHAAFSTPYPPSDATFAGRLMLDVALGIDDLDDLREKIEDLVGTGDFPAVYPDEPVPTYDDAVALLDQVVAAHDAVVTAPSHDALALAGVLQTLPARGVAVSFGEGFDAREGAQMGHAAALRLDGAIGYVYSHTQDLERLVLSDQLYLGFSGMSGRLEEEAVAVGRTVVEVLTTAGLPVRWDGDPQARIAVAPVRWELPYADR